jgi:hypothetical protein
MVRFWVLVVDSSTVLGIVSGVAGVALAAVALSRGSLRRGAGWTVVILGGLVIVSAAVLATEERTGGLRRLVDLVPAAIVGGAGLVAAGVGWLLLRRSPPTGEVRHLLRLAHRCLGESAGQPWDVASFVPLTLSRSPYSRTGSVQAGILLRRGPTVLFVDGPPGAGKTVLLRHAVWRILSRAGRRSRPVVPVYLDLADLLAGSPRLSAMELRKLLVERVTATEPDLAPLVTRYLREDEAGVRWLLLGDRFDEAVLAYGGDPTDAAHEVLAAFREVLAATPGSRVILAGREQEWIGSLAVPALRIAPLTRRQRRVMLHQLDMINPDRRRLVSRLLRRPALDELTGNPMLLRLTCEHFRATDAGEVPTTPHEVLAAVITSRLTGSGNGPDLRRTAEDVAYHLAGAGPAPDPMAALAADGHGDPCSDVELLVTAGLLQHEGGSVSFTHRIFEVYFATCALRRPDRPVPAETLLTEDAWQETVIALLAEGTDEFRASLVGTAERLLAEAMITAGIATDLQALRGIEPDEPLPPQPAIFTWPSRVVHVLHVLTYGLRHHPEAITPRLRELAGGYALTALTTGTTYDTRVALTAVPLLDGADGAWTVNRVLSEDGGPWLRPLGALQLLTAPQIFRHVPLWTRLRAVVNLLGTSAGPRPTDPPGPTPASPAERAVRDLSIVLPVTAVLAGLIFASWTPGLVQQAHDVPTAIMAAIYPPMVLCCLYLAGRPWWPPARRAASDARQATQLFSIGAVLLALEMLAYAILELITGGYDLLTGRPSQVLLDLVNSVWLSWPACAALLIVDGAPMSTTDWIFPHLPASRLGRKLLAERLRHYRSRSVTDLFRTTILGWVTPVLVVAGGVAGAATYRMPLTPQADNAPVKLAAGALIIALAIANHFGIRLRRQHKLRRRIERSNGIPDCDTLKDLLYTARTKNETRVLLLLLRDHTPPAQLRPLTTTLDDLERTVSYVGDMPSTTFAIPARMWQYAPHPVTPGFATWIRRYDREHPGWLGWLATGRQRQTLAKIIDRAHTQQR